MNLFSNRIIRIALTSTLLALSLSTWLAGSASAIGGTGTWGSWTGSGGQGLVDVKSGGFTSPSARFTTDGRSFAIPTGASTWLNSATPPGARFGTSRNQSYVQIGTRSGVASTTTMTFDTPTPASGWGFVLGDIDADRIAISAVSSSGTTITNVNAWYRGNFNYCNGVTPNPCTVSTDVPSWDGVNTATGNGRDTDGASLWLAPTQSLSSLTLTFSALSGFPVFQMWLAGDTAPGNRYTITYAARSCDKYTDVMANQARNNLMETLKDVGANTLYATRGNVVRPDVEDDPASGQSACQPLLDWSFASGFVTDGKDTGTYGSLSRVRTPINHTVVTASQTDELDEFGNNTGRTILGAITYTLTDTEVAQTTGGKRFWVQGGVRGNPLNQKENRYGFAGLRCATDNLNADNVEWVSFANSARHRFCYGYYVTPPPVKATIIVRKVLTGSSSVVPFTFHGDISYAADNSFAVNAGSSESFIRAANYPWTFSEDDVQSPYGFASVSCVSAQGTSTMTTDPATRSAVVTASPNDVVTCTFTNKFQPKTQLEVHKVTQGNTGSFDFTVNGVAASGIAVSQVGTPVQVYSKNGLVGGSQVTISEGTLPTAVGGAWTTPTLECSAVDSSGGALAQPSVSGNVLTGATVTLSANDSSKNECIITNTFVPDAKVRIHAKVIGGSGNISAVSSYVINRADGLSLVNSGDAAIEQTIVSDRWDTYTTTDQVSGLNFGQYTVTSYSPADADNHTWSLDDVRCDGGENVTVSGGEIDFALNNTSVSAPVIDCYFTYAVTNLVGLTLEKVSVGALGDFTLAARYEDEESAGMAHVTSEGIKTTALELTRLPEGTAVTLSEPELPQIKNGSWNTHSAGSPTWACTDTNREPVAIQDEVTITLPAQSVTCVAKNVFSPDQDGGTDTPDPQLPEAGGSWWSVLREAWHPWLSLISYLLS